MLNLSSSDFYLAIPSLPSSELEHLSTKLFDDWEIFVDQFLKLPDYSLHLQVEDGSVKGIGAIGASLVAIYLGIGNYGDFVSGLKTISEQVTFTNEFLAEKAKQTFTCPDGDAKSRKRGGSLSELNRLFTKVQKGELTPDEATNRAKILLGDEASTAPGFLDEFGKAINDCPLYPEQQNFPFVGHAEDALLQSDFESNGKNPRKPNQPKPAPPFAQHYRVEVWRDSKKKSKQTRIITL
jgi:hypothetical protein